MISHHDQISPTHSHIEKAEDIINRGGATQVLEIFTPDAEDNIDRKTNMIVATGGTAVMFAQGPF